MHQYVSICLPQTSIPLLREMSRSDKGFAVFARKRGTAFFLTTASLRRGRGTACGGRREKVFSFALFVFRGQCGYVFLFILWHLKTYQDTLTTFSLPPSRLKPCHLFLAKTANPLPRWGISLSKGILIRWSLCQVLGNSEQGIYLYWVISSKDIVR